MWSPISNIGFRAVPDSNKACMYGVRVYDVCRVYSKYVYDIWYIWVWIYILWQFLSKFYTFCFYLSLNMMTRVEGTSYVSAARGSMQTQFSRFSRKTKNHDRPEKFMSPCGTFVSMLKYWGDRIYSVHRSNVPLVRARIEAMSIR